MSLVSLPLSAILELCTPNNDVCMCDLLFYLVIEHKCNNVGINSTTKMATHNVGFSDPLNYSSFKDVENKRALTPKQINYEKYNIPSYKEQYLMGKDMSIHKCMYSSSLDIIYCKTQSLKVILYRMLFSSSLSENSIRLKINFNYPKYSFYNR